MNAFVLTSPLAGVMLLTRRQPFYPSAAHDKFRSICTTNDLYTEFGIALLDHVGIGFAAFDNSLLENHQVLFQQDDIRRFLCHIYGGVHRNTDVS